MNSLQILNIGGDSRQVHLINHLISMGYSVTSYGLISQLLSPDCKSINNYKDALQNFNIVIGPTPFSKDGKQINTLNNDIIIYINEFKSYLTSNHIIIGGSIPGILTDALSKKNITVIDLLKNDAVAIENAVSTAEGAIAKAITKSSINLNNSKCLVLGYGRCGKVLANKLSGIGANVSISARSKENKAIATSYGLKIIDDATWKNELNTFEFIFNTVPAPLLAKEQLLNVNENATIIDIASAPGGLDYEFVNEKKINAYLYLGIPGKISPKTSGIILANAIIEYLKERCDVNDHKQC